MTSELVRIGPFRQALAEAQTIPEVKNLADQFSLFKQWLAKQKAGREAINAGAELMLRAERKLGEMLENMEKNPGSQGQLQGNPVLGGNIVLPPSDIPKLSDIGIAKIQSHRWQRVALVPSDVFEQYLQLTKAKSDDEQLEYITREGLLMFYVKQQTSEDNVIPLPEGVYNVIYADPPWQYGNQIESWGPTTGRQQIMHYAGLPLEIITYYTDKNGKEIKDCFAENAVLFLWATNPFLKDGLQVVSNWGFEYKTNIVWVKTNIKRPGSGFWVRGRHELLFIAARGAFLPNQEGKSPIGSVVDWPDTLLADQQEHSRKPVEVYSLIETMYPEGKYLELFARNIRQGWESWGDEVRSES